MELLELLVNAVDHVLLLHLEFRDHTAKFSCVLLGVVKLRSELDAQSGFRLAELDAQGGDLSFDVLRELKQLVLNLEVVGALCLDLNLRGHAHIIVTFVHRRPDLDQ